MKHFCLLEKYDLKSARQWLRDHDLLHKVVSHDFTGPAFTYYFVQKSDLMGRHQQSPSINIPGFLPFTTKMRPTSCMKKCAIDNKEDLNSFYAEQREKILNS